MLVVSFLVSVEPSLIELLKSGVPECFPGTGSALGDACCVVTSAATVAIWELGRPLLVETEEG